MAMIRRHFSLYFDLYVFDKQIDGSASRLMISGQRHRLRGTSPLAMLINSRRRNRIAGDGLSASCVLRAR